VVKCEACGARLNNLLRTPTDTLLSVPEPPLVPAQGVRLPVPTLTLTCVAVKAVPDSVTHLLFLQTVTRASCILLYSYHTTRLATHTYTDPAPGEKDWDTPGLTVGGDTAVGGTVAFSST